MEYKKAGSLEVAVLAAAVLPDPGTSPRVFRIARERWRTGTGVITRRDGMDRFVLVLGGRGANVRHGPILYAPGQIVLIPAGEIMRLFAADGEDLSLLIATASTPAFRKKLAKKTGEGILCMNLRSFSEAESLFVGCLNHAMEDDAFRLRTSLAYFRTFLALLAEDLISPRQFTFQGERSFARARKIIDDSAGSAISAEESARRIGLSPDYLNRLFRRYAGETLHEYIIRRKMAVAAEWLRRDGMGIEEAAERLGYADRFSFSKAFTRHFGVTPARWRVS